MIANGSSEGGGSEIVRKIQLKHSCRVRVNTRIFFKFLWQNLSSKLSELVRRNQH